MKSIFSILVVFVGATALVTAAPVESQDLNQKNHWNMKWTLAILAAFSTTLVAAAPAKITLDTITVPTQTLDTRDMMRPQRHCSEMLWISLWCTRGIDENDPEREVKHDACMGAEWECDCALSNEGCGDPWGDPWGEGHPPMFE
ncbi:hypothetical protein E4T39_02707 [Aureobasidium subglaciale]|nr:hypothetical protein E4T39_02707 [Aureobasidium subglaciale]